MVIKLRGAILALILSSISCAPNNQPQNEYFWLMNKSDIPQSAPLLIEQQIKEPVLLRGNSGEWDSVDVLNPSVIKLNNEFLNYYSGYDGKVWRTGLAKSTNGISWVKSQKNPLLESGNGWDKKYISANGAAIAWKGKILYFYQGNDNEDITKIGLATSVDGEIFNKLERPVLETGEVHSWDGKAVGDPYVIQHDGKLYIYYLGMDEYNVQRLGLAKSADGEHWIKYAGNPIMDVGSLGAFDENGLGEPSVVYSAPYFYMLYTGRSATERRDIGYAISKDGVAWKKMNIQGLFGDNLRSKWNSNVICDTTLTPNSDGTFAVYYGGGDVSEPAQNLHGQIGVFNITLSPKQLALGFNASVDYSKYGLHSYDILSGSWDIEGNSAWIAPKASVTIATKPINGQALVIAGWMPAAMHKKDVRFSESPSITIKINDTPVRKKIFTDDEMFTETIGYEELSKFDIKNVMVVTIETNHAIVPSKISDTKDDRSLALKISRIEITN